VILQLSQSVEWRHEPVSEPTAHWIPNRGELCQDDFANSGLGGSSRIGRRRQLRKTLDLQDPNEVNDPNFKYLFGDWSHESIFYFLTSVSLLDPDEPAAERLIGQLVPHDPFLGICPI
jgi:hypothetical protein